MLGSTLDVDEGDLLESMLGGEAYHPPEPQSLEETGVSPVVVETLVCKYLLQVGSASGREIAVFNLGSRFLATVNQCPHKGGPLCDGIVTGTSVVCPLHGWKVNLETGRVGRPAGIEACITSYPTRVDAGVIVVGVPSTFLKPSDGKAA